MGRITKSFRIQFQEEIRTLKKFRNALVDFGHRDAFDRLLKVWGSTQGAMAYADIPYVLDAMVLTAVVDNRKRIMQLSSRLDCVTEKMTEIQKKLEPQVKTEFGRGIGDEVRVENKRLEGAVSSLKKEVSLTEQSSMSIMRARSVLDVSVQRQIYSGVQNER